VILLPTATNNRRCLCMQPLTRPNTGWSLNPCSYSYTNLFHNQIYHTPPDYIKSNTSFINLKHYLGKFHKASTYLLVTCACTKIIIFEILPKMAYEHTHMNFLYSNLLSASYMLHYRIILHVTNIIVVHSLCTSLLHWCYHESSLVLLLRQQD